MEVEPADADVALYHIGNNHLHRAIYQRALAHPGVVVLHDAVLQHFFLGTLDQRAYARNSSTTTANGRAVSPRICGSTAPARPPTRAISNFPMLKRLATASRAVIVHNPAAAAIVRRHAPDARVIRDPASVSSPAGLPDPVDTLRFRAELGLGPRTLLVGVFGHLRESKRLPVVLRAMERVWNEGADARLLMQGAFASSDLERSLTRTDREPADPADGLSSRARFLAIGRRHGRMHQSALPTAAETSGIAVRMMGIGKTGGFSSGEEIARIPENACLRVDPGPARRGDAGRLPPLARGAIARPRRRSAGARRRTSPVNTHRKSAAKYWNALKYWTRGGYQYSEMGLPFRPDPQVVTGTPTAAVDQPGLEHQQASRWSPFHSCRSGRAGPEEGCWPVPQCRPIVWLSVIWVSPAITAHSPAQPHLP